MARNGWAEPFANRAAAFRLCCRGGVRLLHGARDITPKSKKGRALLALLAAERRPLSRTRIIDLLWSDRQEEQARASLRTLLADLRVQWGADFADILVAEREQIALAPSVRTELSEPAFGGAGGELFEGLDHLDPEFDEWLRLERGKASSERHPSPAGASKTASTGNPLSPRRLTILVALLALAGIFALFM